MASFSSFLFDISLQAVSGQPKRAAFVHEDKKVVHTTWENGTELVEEFDIRSDDLLLRKVRSPTTLGGVGQWEYEVGRPPRRRKEGSDFLMRAIGEPEFFRKDTVENFRWRIRGIPYPEETYKLTIDHARQQIVIRTTNRKYFKRFSIPDMMRAGLILDEKAISHTWANNTLVISYKKPEIIVQLDLAAKLERKTMRIQKPPKDGDVECPTQ